MTDPISELIRNAKGGDRTALNRLLARNRERLDRMVKLRLGEGLKAKVQSSDILQSTFLEVLRGLGDFAGETEESFVQWVKSIVETTVHDRARFYRAQRRTDAREVFLEEARGAPQGGPSVSSVAAFGEDLRTVQDALARLAPEHREVIELKVLQGLPHAEVARRMDRSEWAARALLARARAALIVEIDLIRQCRPGSPKENSSRPTE